MTGEELQAVTIQVDLIAAHMGIDTERSLLQKLVQINTTYNHDHEDLPHPDWVDKELADFYRKECELRMHRKRLEKVYGSNHMLKRRKGFNEWEKVRLHYSGDSGTTEHLNKDNKDKGNESEDLPSEAKPIIESSAPRARHSGKDFQEWHHATAKGRLEVRGPTMEMTIDTGAVMSTINKEVLLKAKPNATIRKTPGPLHGRGFADKLINVEEYTALDLYFEGLANGESRLCHIQREFRVVKDDSFNLLIGIDIMDPEGILLDFETRTVVFPECEGLEADLDVLNPNWHSMSLEP
ncbi:MAG: hypothetical protein M1836_002321 [Candelina mexicana]|nr:MAG: hypothetical protein M1836_002321 [Candelina mexicana]